MNNDQSLQNLVHELVRVGECEWIEFKQNNAKKEDVGQYIAALSNAALLNGRDKAYCVFGIADQSNNIVGTRFSATKAKVGNQELQSWLLQRLQPKIDFHFKEVVIDKKTIVILEINPANQQPTSFDNIKYIRVGSTNRKLQDYPQKESQLWQLINNVTFESQLSLLNLEVEQVIELLEYSSYFELVGAPIPDGHEAILSKLTEENLIKQEDTGKYSITNLGAILFAKDLTKFPNLTRKAVRVIQYKNSNKLETIREKLGNKGYAVGFDNLIEYIMSLLPAKEDLTDAIREQKTMLPILAVRELVANAILHQDFFATGSGVMIEIFNNRLEITNPGKPIVDINRFLDVAPQTRNEKLARLLRRLGICEERGSGVDKVIFEIEINQLPAPLFEISGNATRVILFSHHGMPNITKSDRIRACYFHASLKYIERDFMTNTSLRQRFGIEKQSSAMVSRFINDALKAKVICTYDESVGAKSRKYVPIWAKPEK